MCERERVCSICAKCNVQCAMCNVQYGKWVPIKHVHPFSMHLFSTWKVGAHKTCAPVFHAPVFDMENRSTYSHTDLCIMGTRVWNTGANVLWAPIFHIEQGCLYLHTHFKGNVQCAMCNVQCVMCNVQFEMSYMENGCQCFTFYCCRLYHVEHGCQCFMGTHFPYVQCFPYPRQVKAPSSGSS